MHSGFIKYQKPEKQNTGFQNEIQIIPDCPRSSSFFNLQDNYKFKIRMMRDEVDDSDFVRNTFYTWTTIQQVNELSTSNSLLTRSKTDDNEYSLFDFSLRVAALKKNPFTRLLKQRPFAKKRFAWTNSWATIMGWKNEMYGNQLIKIVIRNRAIVGKFNTTVSREPFSFFNLKNEKLTTDYVLKNKNRIAVIYHLNRCEGNGMKRKQKKRKKRKTDIDFREFVIINERMIKNWSYGTPVIKARMTSEIAWLKKLQKYAEANRVSYRPGRDVWDNGKVAEKISSVIQKYNASICFRNSNYFFNGGKLQKMIMKMQMVLKEQSTKRVKVK
jgi:hypothetical protein